MSDLTPHGWDVHHGLHGKHIRSEEVQSVAEYLVSNRIIFRVSSSSRDSHVLVSFHRPPALRSESDPEPAVMTPEHILPIEFTMDKQDAAWLVAYCEREMGFR